MVNLLYSISKLLRQLKGDYQIVNTTLGGSQLGYLALTILLIRYSSIPNSALFRRPADPCTLLPVSLAAGCVTRAAAPTPLSAAEIATQKMSFDDKKCQYNECQAVEANLRNQIIDTIEPNFLQFLHFKYRHDQ